MNTKNIILKAENISKQYRLGTVGTGTLSHDLNRWWHSIRGKEDPYLKVGDINDRSSKGTSEYVWALKDINFEVEAGEVLGIIGKNGAGKSTLLKILSKVTTPTTGSIKYKGRIASLLEVGTGFNPELTGRENIYLNGAILGMTKKEITSKLAEIIEFSGCERYIDTPTKRYSSGMTVRLAFAVAAFLEPEILVIDEVLAVGDAEFQKKAIGKMQDISRQGGRTVLFVSHNMAAVKSLCTRGIVLENGRVVFDGGIEECINKYLENNKVNCNWKNNTQQMSGISLLSVFTTVTGKQPNFKLNIATEVLIKDPINKKGFLAFYIGGNDSTPLMEAIPAYDFIDCSEANSIKKINIEIELKGFIPRIYTLGVWIGIDHNITLDWKKEIIMFEIDSSPIPNRTINFPNHAGFIVPESRLIDIK